MLCTLDVFLYNNNMHFHSDKHGSKFPLLFILVIVIYLAFFDFNVKEAVQYTIKQNKQFFGF